MGIWVELDSLGEELIKLIKPKSPNPVFIVVKPNVWI